MRSPTARLILIALACFVSAGAAIYGLQLERLAAERRQAMAAFDRTARSVILSLDGARAAQLGYVAEGQGPAIWHPTVDAALTAIPSEIDSLRSLSGAVESRAMLIEATARLRSFSEVDNRALEYLGTGDTLMASDLVFTEGAQAVAAALDLVDSAWRREVAWIETMEQAHRRTLAFTAGGGVVFLLLALLALAIPSGVPVRAGKRQLRARREMEPGLDLRLREPAAGTTPTAAAIAVTEPAADPDAETAPGSGTTTNSAPPEAANPAGTDTRSLSSLMRTAADICVSLGAVRDADALRDLVARAAALMEAPGLIVWVGDPDAGAIRASVAQGYSAQALTRMPPIARDANNAVAAACRTGALQTVAGSRSEPGAIVAPLLTPAGCVGALTAEVSAGREADECTQALALLFAAQLAALLAADAERPGDSASTGMQAATA